MKEFLRDPIFWIRETLRWHWWDIIVIFGSVWFLLAILLLLVSHAFE